VKDSSGKPTAAGRLRGLGAYGLTPPPLNGPWLGGVDN